MVEEIDIGITHFISKGEEIKGAYKYKYSDFIVNEITPEGEVVFLNRNYQMEYEEKLKKEKEELEKEKEKMDLTNLRLKLEGIIDEE
jgi:hypothetical protein